MRGPSRLRTIPVIRIAGPGVTPGSLHIPTWRVGWSPSGRRPDDALPYPPRPQLKPLPEFAGSAHPRPDPALQRRVEEYISSQYTAGRSLRELAELTDRSHSAIRNILHKHGLNRRDVGAPRSEHRD